MRLPRPAPTLPTPRLAGRRARSSGPVDQPSDSPLSATAVGVVACDSAGHVTLVNDTARSWGLADLAAASVLDADGLSELSDDQLPWRRVLAAGVGQAQEIVLAVTGRPGRRLLCVGRALSGDDSPPGGAVVALHDISGLQHHDTSVHRSAFHDAVLAASPDLIFVFDPVSGNVVWSAPGPLDLLGHTGALPPGVVADPTRDGGALPVHRDDAARLRAADLASVGLEDGQVLQVRYRARDSAGDYRWLSRRVTPFSRGADGAVHSVLAIARDVTDVVQMEQRLSNAALHDPLTGLPNRTLLTDRLALALSRTARSGDEVVVLFCDLDGFKHVNDTAGHAAGDAVLVATARRLQEVLRPEDTVARVGGDEFVVVLEPVRRGVAAHMTNEMGDEVADPRADAVTIARRISDAVRQPVDVDGTGHVVTASIGVTFATAGDLPDDALRDADSAMYLAKSRGKDRYEVFEVSLRQDAVERGRVEHVLRSGLRHRAGDGDGAPAAVLSVAYQPILDLDTQQLVGVEALARLVDGEGAGIGPDAFIPVAEDTGLIGPLGRFVLDTACADLAAWHAQHPDSRHVGVAVNVSARQARLPGLVGVVEDALRRTGLAASCLTLELTESVLLEAGQVTTTALRALRALGVQISIDDFGTGYASLRYLTQLPVTAVKVDRSFTSGLPHDSSKATIVRAVTTLATELGLSCVVEGIETEEQLHALPSGLLGQGYLLGRPMTAADLGRRLGRPVRRPDVPDPVALPDTPAVRGARPAALPALPPEVLDPARLEAVRATGLLDAAAGRSWDELTTLAGRLLRTPMAFMTMVDDSRSYWLSCIGVDGLGPGENQNLVHESFCQYVIVDGAPFLVDDAVTHPRTRDNPSVSALGVRAWAGCPVQDSEGRTLGSFCVLDTVSRTWSEDDAEVLGVLAAAASAQVQLMSAVHAERLAQDRLQRLAAVALQLAAAETVDELTDIVINRGLPVLGADGGAVLVNQGSDMVLLGVSDRLGTLAPCQVARTGRRLQLPTRAVGLACSPEMAEVYERTQRSAWVCSPMRSGSELSGALAVSWVEEREFDDAELDLVDAFAAQCAQALERIRAVECRRAVDGQMRQLAETLQQSLLTPPPSSDQLSVVVRYRPASDQARVGGDWYDAFEQPDGATMLVVGDVVGHDGEAAAQMGQLRGLVRALAYGSVEAAGAPATPAGVLTRVEHVARGLAVEALATAVLMRVTPVDDPGAAGASTVQWSNAGHLPPVVLLADGTASLLDTEPDLLLGIMPDTTRTDHVAILPAGATLLLFTDGLVERRGAGLDTGLGRLREALTGLQDEALDPLCDMLLARLAPGAVEDDIALLAVRARPASAAGHPPGLPVELAARPGGPASAGAAARSAAPFREDRPSDGATAVLTLSPDPAAVGIARRFVDDACRAAGTTGELRDSTVLLTSEVVTSAFLYGRNRTRIVVSASVDRVRVEVTDDRVSLPRREGQDIEDLSGRGIALVEALATRWGVREHDGARTVWFEVVAGQYS